MNIGNGRNQAEHGKVLEKALHGDNQKLRDYKDTLLTCLSLIQKKIKNPAPYTLIAVQPFVYKGLKRVYTFKKCTPTHHPQKILSLNLRIGV
jgi:hypothetical protein